MPLRTRKPKGAYVVPTPEWFSDVTAYAGSALSFGGIGQTVLSLYNNSNIGQSLHVYGVWVDTQVKSSVLIGPIVLTPPLISPQADPTPMYAGGAILPGIIDQEYFIVTPFVTGQVFEIFTYTLHWEWNKNYPMAIIPAGYALAVSMTDAGVGLTASFSWTVLSDIN